MLLATNIIMLSYYITRDLYNAESFLIDQPEEKTVGEIIFAVGFVTFAIVGFIIKFYSK